MISLTVLLELETWTGFIASLINVYIVIICVLSHTYILDVFDTYNTSLLYVTFLGQKRIFIETCKGTKTTSETFMSTMVSFMILPN